MARALADRELGPVIDAAQQWAQNCLIDDRSVFSPSKLWTVENVAEVRAAFVDHPDMGDDSFSTKLKGQMKSAAPVAQQLMAEMIWVLLLFPSNIKSTTKRDQVRDIWSTSGEELAATHPMLSDEVLNGIGSGGLGFNNHRWRELTFLIEITTRLKQQPISERQLVLSDYDKFVVWIEEIPRDGKRQFRHMLRYFLFAERVERMSSNRDRRAILASYKVAAENETKKWSDRQLDAALLVLRKKLEGEFPGQVLDFYEPPLKQQWSRSDSSPSDPVLETIPRFWVEKTIVKGRADREAGEHALGHALWSPQRAEGGRDIYRLMRALSPGDIVFHFVDNEALTSFSEVSAAASDFVGLEGTEWGGRPAFRVQLKNHQQIISRIERSEFLQAPEYRPAVDDLLATTKGLFFNREHNLNQGSYISEALRWPPKVGQVGSLTQSQNNDPHVKEASSAQSRSESQSWS